MKISLVSQKIEDKMRKKTAARRFERFLFKTFIIIFIIMIASQTAAIKPSMRSSALDDSYVNGELLSEESFFFTPCRMELKLINLDRSPDLKILVNGKEKYSFENSSVLMELKDGDVVELDASSVLTPAKLQISAVSENISGILGKTISASEGITLVVKIKTQR